MDLVRSQVAPDPVSWPTAVPATMTMSTAPLQRSARQSSVRTFKTIWPTPGVSVAGESVSGGIRFFDLRYISLCCNQKCWCYNQSLHRICTCHADSAIMYSTPVHSYKDARHHWIRYLKVTDSVNELFLFYFHNIIGCSKDRRKLQMSQSSMPSAWINKRLILDVLWAY